MPHGYQSPALSTQLQVITNVEVFMLAVVHGHVSQENDVI